MSFLLIVRDNGVFIVAGGTVVVVVVASSSCVIVPFNRLFTNWESLKKRNLIALLLIRLLRIKNCQSLYISSFFIIGITSDK